MTQRIEVSTHCPAPRRTMFDLARSQGAHVGSMAWSDERISHGPPDDLLELGDEVTFRGRHFGLGFTLTGKITNWCPITASPTSRCVARSAPCAISICSSTNPADA